MRPRPSIRDSRYNYRRFDAGHYDFSRFRGPEVGEPFPQLSFETPDGGRVHTEDLHGRPTVIESGSLTCPVFVGHVGTMNRLAREHPEVDFRVLYVREAHPGEKIGPHRSMADKCHDAMRLVREEGERRDILLDDIVGSAHRALGSFPDFVYVLDADNVVRYRSEWNDPEAIREVLSDLQDDQPNGWTRPRPHVPPQSTVVRTLKRAGWVALWDLYRAVPRLVAARRRLARQWDRRAGEPVGFAKAS